ncbi:MAG: hypothetical protein EHM46_05305 [Bacteroidetes bacterium]|nr:MAG: hypothetical protein EHM46_05305 [Bacteroidota bacterium]
MAEQVIMSSQSPATGIDFGSIIPPEGQSFTEQVHSCIEQLQAFIFPAEQPRFFITRQTFFILARNRAEYDGRSAEMDLADPEIFFSHLRVYVKFREDIPVVRKICGSMLDSYSSLYLQSDICREEQLVEIEGICELPPDTGPGQSSQT